MILNKTLSTPQRLAKARNRRIDQEYGNNSFLILMNFCQCQHARLHRCRTGTTPILHRYQISTTVPYLDYQSHFDYQPR